LPTPPYPRLADHEVLDASLVFFLKLLEESFEVLKGERVTQRGYSLSPIIRMGGDLRLLEELDRTPSLHGDRQERVILEVDQKLVFLGNRVLARVEQDPLSSSPKHKYVIWFHGNKDPGAVFCRWAHHLTPENSLILFS